MAAQLGGPVLKDEFRIGRWINVGTDRDKVARYLPLWRYSNPPEFADHPWDYSTFGRGERFVRQPISEVDFDRPLAEAHRWGLDNHMTERAYDKVFQATV